MAKKSRGKKKKTTRRKPPPTTGPASVDDITDDILELILLRLDSSLCLVRAAFTCKRWRRIVADAGFLLRFRSIHAAAVVGHYYVVDPNYAVEQPPQSPNGNRVIVPSSPAAFDSSRFSLDFLPNSCGWELADIRGSLLLLFRTSRGDRFPGERFPRFPDLVVCEPLTRRYQGIVPPAELQRWRYLGAVLLDGDPDELGGCVSMSNFRVICAVHGNETPRACVFSSGSNGGWHVVRSAVADGIYLDRLRFLYFAGRAGGSLYWGLGYGNGNVLVLDESTAEFSVDVFPPNMRWAVDSSILRVISGHGGGVRIVRVATQGLEVCAQLPNSGEWAVEKRLRLSEATRGLPGHKETYFGNMIAMIVSVGAGFVVLTPAEETWLFSVNLETMEVESTHERNRYPGEAYPYVLPWPPALHACVDRGSRRRSQ